jgi:serine phosphatase RsbU (regulator of sigma subunit)
VIAFNEMKLRTRLVLAFFLMAVVPLFVVTLASYWNTQRAFRKAVESEAAAVAEDMSARMDTVTRDLGRRLEGLGQIPFTAALAKTGKSGEAASEVVLAQLQRHMGDVAGMVASLEIVPPEPHADPRPDPRAEPEARAAPQPTPSAQAVPSPAVAPQAMPPPAVPKPRATAAADGKPALPQTPRRGAIKPATDPAVPQPAGPEAGKGFGPPPPGAPPVIVLAPEPAPPGEGAPGVAGRHRWVFKHKEMSHVAEAIGKEIQKHAKVIEQEVLEVQRDADPEARAESRRRREEAQLAIRELSREVARIALEQGKLAAASAARDTVKAAQEAAEAARAAAVEARRHAKERSEDRAAVQRADEAERRAEAAARRAERAAEEGARARERRADEERRRREREAELAAQAKEREAQLAEQAKEREARLAARAKEREGQLAEQARERARDAQKREEERKAREAEAAKVRASQPKPSPKPAQLKLHFGKGFDYAVRSGDAGAGTVRAQLRSREILANVFSRTRRRPDEIPFALDPDGELYASDADKPKLAELPLTPAADGAPANVQKTARDWVVVTRRDPGSGLTLGIARPVGEPLQELRLTAVRNLGYGLALVGAALVAILPLSGRMTRDLTTLTQGAERLAAGDLRARVSVRSRDEIGRLADTFNRMAHDLHAHQERLIGQERLRKELEMGRRIQEEMLPHERLRAPFGEIKGISIPAREVGGDFFNYFLLHDRGEAALLVGDVSGKGVAAALLMANVQATLRARLPLERNLATLARYLDEEIEATTPPAVYLTAFMGVLDGSKRVMRYVNAGHNAPLVLRRDGRVESLDSTGRPLGLLPGGGYEERAVSFGEGDWLFLYTDGIVESESPQGEPFGADRLQELLRTELGSGIDGILTRVEQAVREFRGGQEAADDATLVVVRVGGAS